MAFTDLKIKNFGMVVTDGGFVNPVTVGLREATLQDFDGMYELLDGSANAPFHVVKSAYEYHEVETLPVVPAPTTSSTPKVVLITLSGKNGVKCQVRGIVRVPVEKYEDLIALVKAKFTGKIVLQKTLTADDIAVNIKAGGK